MTMRIVFYACVFAAAIACFVFGLFGWAGAGLCDTSCPSDEALANYKRLFWGGGGTLIAMTLWLMFRIATRHRRSARKS